MPVRSGSLRAQQRAVRLRLVPLPYLPAQQRRSGAWRLPASRDGDLVCDHRRRRGRSGPLRAASGIATFCGECGTPLYDHGRSSARNARFQRRHPRRSGRGCARIPHLLGKQGRLVRPRRRPAEARQVPAGYAWASNGTEPPDDPWRRATSSRRSTGPARRGCFPATAGSGCAARRRPSARPAGRP